MLKVTSGIYSIVNSVTGSLYIGSSSNIEKRFYHHKKALLRGNHVNPYLQNSVNKHGIDKFNFSVVYQIDCGPETLLQYEYLFMLSESSDKLYNIVCPLKSFNPSLNYQEFLKKRAEAWKEAVKNRGGLPSKSSKSRELQSIAVSGERNGFYGKKHTPETIENLREKAIKRWEDPEERRLQSERRKKYFEDPEARSRVGMASKGRPQSLKQKTKMSEIFSGSGNPNAQPFILNGVRYGSFKEAEGVLGLSKYKIKKLLKPNDYL